MAISSFSDQVESSATNAKEPHFVQLYCPDRSVTISKFDIAVTRWEIRDLKWLQHLEDAIRKRLKEHDIFPYTDLDLCDTNGESLREHIMNSRTNGLAGLYQILISIGKRKLESRRPLKIQLHLQWDRTGEKCFRFINTREVHEYIRTIRLLDNSTDHNILYLTAPYLVVKNNLSQVSQGSHDRDKLTLSINTINTNWFDPRFDIKWAIPQSGDSKPLDWGILNIPTSDERLLEVLATLSVATIGQRNTIYHLVLREMSKRISVGDEKVLKEEDLQAVIQHVYTEANALDSTWPTTEGEEEGSAWTLTDEEEGEEDDNLM